MNEQEKRYLIWLYTIKGLELWHAAALERFFGSAQAVFENAQDTTVYEALASVQDKKAVFAALKAALNEGAVESANRQLEKAGVTTYFKEEFGYPSRLLEIDDAPRLLFAKGNTLPDQPRMVAFVGTRKASNMGRQVARKLAYELAREGIVIVSGMAAGIDTAAHEGALEAGGQTLAVLGCGVDVVYPPSNVQLYHDIQQQGAVLSEYALGAEPDYYHFPVRNRIISGMSEGVVVIECPQKSGTMITARLCVEQGRTLFVTPNSPLLGSAEGSNELLLSGAQIVLGTQDILSTLGWGKSLSNAPPRVTTAELNGMEQAVVEELGRGEASLEQLQRAAKQPIDEVMVCLTLLEIRGIIKQLPGQQFVLTANVQRV